MASAAPLHFSHSKGHIFSGPGPLPPRYAGVQYYTGWRSPGNLCGWLSRSAVHWQTLHHDGSTLTAKWLPEGGPPLLTAVSHAYSARFFGVVRCRRTRRADVQSHTVWFQHVDGRASQILILPVHASQPPQTGACLLFRFVPDCAFCFMRHVDHRSGVSES